MEFAQGTLCALVEREHRLAADHATRAGGGGVAWLQGGALALGRGGGEAGPCNGDLQVSGAATQKVDTGHW
jgi:hypothetical protein